jgi:hypothetical protein
MLQALRRNDTHLNDKLVPIRHMSRNQCDISVIYKRGALCGCPAFNSTFISSFHRGGNSMKILGFMQV